MSWRLPQIPLRPESEEEKGARGRLAGGGRQPEEGGRRGGGRGGEGEEAEDEEACEEAC